MSEAGRAGAADTAGARLRPLTPGEPWTWRGAGRTGSAPRGTHRLGLRAPLKTPGRTRKASELGERRLPLRLHAFRRGGDAVCRTEARGRPTATRAGPSGCARPPQPDAGRPQVRGPERSEARARGTGSRGPHRGGSRRPHADTRAARACTGQSAGRAWSRPPRRDRDSVRAGGTDAILPAPACASWTLENSRHFLQRAGNGGRRARFKRPQGMGPNFC